MENTNEKKYYEVAAEWWKNEVEKENSKQSKPLRIKTKLNMFEKDLIKLFKHHAKSYLSTTLIYNVGDDGTIFDIMETAKISEIPASLLPKNIKMIINSKNKSVIITDYNENITTICEGINEEESVKEETSIDEDTGSDDDDEEESSEDKSKKDKEEVKVDFQDIFDRSFKKLVVKNNPITTKEEATSLVRQYYDCQDLRIGASNRQFQNDKNDEETAKARKKKEEAKKNISFAYAKAGLKETEELITLWLEDYVKQDPIGKWLLSIKGIGPVIAAGLLSYIDITKCQTAGSIWKYAGWEGHRPPKKKGVKLDYNPDFRVLCWKCGEQFQKVSGYKKDKKTKQLILDKNGQPIYRIKDAVYGHLYMEKLKVYIAKNEAGGFAENAKLALEEKEFENKEIKAIYESGKLPMCHLISMAKRYSVKIFLSHLFEVWYEYENKCKPPRPFVEVYCGHVHMIEAPNKEILGLK